MSILEIYINWVNSVLAKTECHVDGVEAVQDGKVLCELIDILAPGADLQGKVKATGDCTPIAYINAALEHMKNHGVKIKFPAEDIIHNEIKSMLDILWLLILNYGIHSIGQNYFQRSVALGKKNLLEWCQEELGTTFNARNTLTFNLCNENWFLRLLEKVTGHRLQKLEDKSEYIDALLTEIQGRYLIKKDIIKAPDIVAGSIDEHTLMIYLSLLKRRQRGQASASDSHRSRSADSAKEYGLSHSSFGRSSSAHAHRNGTWLSTDSYFSGQETSPPIQHSTANENMYQTFSDRVMEHPPHASSDREDGGKEMESQRISEKETDTLSDFSSSLLVREKFPKNLSEQRLPSMTSGNREASLMNVRTHQAVMRITDCDSQSREIEHALSSFLQQDDHRNRESGEENVNIRIKRPKDYIHQWEDTMDRLSSVSVMDKYGLPRTPLISNYKITIPSRSRSLELERASSRFTHQRSYSPASWRNSRNVMSTFTVSPERATSYNLGSYTPPSGRSRYTGSGLESMLDRSPENMHQKAQKASKLIMHTSGPRAITLIDTLKQARENVHQSMPHESPRPQPSHTSSFDEDREQTVKGRDNSESLRVRFQALALKPQGVPQSSGLQSYLNVTSCTAPQVRSISPRRRAVSSGGMLGSGERGSDIMLSVSPRSKSMSPQRTLTAVVGNSPRVEGSAERGLVSGVKVLNSSVRTTIAEFTGQKSISPKTTATQSADQRGTIPSHRTITAESAGQRGILPSSERNAETLTSNSSTAEVARLEFGPDSFLNHWNDDREDSLLLLRRGGAGRVPRREAWEEERRKQEDLTLAGTWSNSAAQSRFMEVLSREIKVLKQKVELMEDRERQSATLHSHSPNTKLRNSYAGRKLRNENNPIIPASHSKDTIPRDRATSCPLLQLSRRSVITRSYPRVSVTSANTQVAYSSSSLYPRSAPQSNATSPQRHGDLSLGHANPTFNVTANDFNESHSLERQEKWKQLISQRNLTEMEVIELKQALALTIAENDILQAKLTNARHEIQDKLKHTNGVLDDCRRHLAKIQVDNTELRSMLEQERRRSSDYEERIKELENSMFEVKAENKELESELQQTTSLLDHSLTKAQPSVEALKEENTRLISRLAKTENENDSLRVDIENLKHSQAQALKTMDDLRECLSKVRRERQELFDEVTSFQRQEQSNRVREIMSHYQEKGAKDEGEREQAGMSRPYFQRPDSSSHLSQRYNGSYDDDVLHMSSPRQVSQNRSSSWQRYIVCDDLSSEQNRQIYPHRKNYIPHSRSCSPHRGNQRVFFYRYSSPLQLNKSHADQSLKELEHDIKMEQLKLINHNRSPSPKHRLQFSTFTNESDVAKTKFSRFDNKRYVDSPAATNYSSHISDHFKQPVSGTGSVLGRLNKSFNSLEDLPKMQERISHSYYSNLTPKSERLKRGITDNQRRSLTRERNLSAKRARSPALQGTCLGRTASPKAFPHESHSPPTRLSPEEKKKKKRRPLHSKSGAGEIARHVQKEFDKDDELIQTLSQSASVPNGSQLDMQSESDGEDTGINSSMSSRSSCERSLSRKKIPQLSDEQRRYADELIQKYTGSLPLK